jgi:hypothetical protein
MADNKAEKENWRECKRAEEIIKGGRREGRR